VSAASGMWVGPAIADIGDGATSDPVRTRGGTGHRGDGVPHRRHLRARRGRHRLGGCPGRPAELQSYSDASALAGAQEYAINTSATASDDAHYVALLYMEKELGASGLPSGCVSSTSCPAGSYTFPNGYTVTLHDPGSSSLDVAIKHTQASFLGGLIGFNTDTDASSGRARASTAGGGGPCALCLLDPSGKDVLGGTGNGGFTVNNGNIVINSNNSEATALTGNGGVAVSNGANSAITVVGGWRTSGSGTYTPVPITGRNPVPDPLAGIPVPSVTGTSTDVNVTGTPTTINPGIYGKIDATGTASLTLNPGTYVITTELKDTGSGAIIGSGVTLYFACSAYPTPCSGPPAQSNHCASLSLTGNGTLDLTPPSSGTYQGLLVFYDRENGCGMAITGNGGASTAADTIYGKSALLTLTGNGGSLDSMIVTDSVTVTGNGSLAVNYDANQNYPLPDLGGLTR
jgi:hypothetical protein